MKKCIFYYNVKINRFTSIKYNKNSNDFTKKKIKSELNKTYQKTQSMLNKCST